jgi:superfamily II DNA or RNA helicase
MTFELRDYQRECIDAVQSAGLRVDRSVVVLPTGSGKTVIFAHLTREWLAAAPGPVLILVHRDELVHQTVAKLRAIMPEVPLGIVKAERNDFATVTVASVQTLSRDARLRQMPQPSLVIVDEAHHAAADSYKKVLHEAGCFTTRACYAVGFTATLMRADERGLGDVWQEIAYQRSILGMIKAKWLVDVRGKSVPIDGLDLDTVKHSGGDYQAGSLASELAVRMVPDAVAEAYAEHASDRPGVLFAPTVESAYQFGETLAAKGITTATVDAGTPTEERQLIYKRHAHGDVQVITNCGVLTEGWDSPATSVCVVARPTTSTGLYIQMVGRVLRPFPGKGSALVLDVTGAARRHSLATIGALLSTDRPMRDGQSLLEAEIETVGGTDTEVQYVLDSRVVDVDLFTQSMTQWLRTDRGVWFVPAGKMLYFLWEAPDGGYIPARCDSYGGNAVKGLDDPVPIDMAMTVAAEAALNADASIAHRKASWRRRKEPVTPAQLSVLGDAAYDGLTKRDASDMISIKFASRALKRFAPQERVSHDG